MTTYYRFTDSSNPMSNLGHAMLSNDPYTNANYGDNLFVFNGDNAVGINTLTDKIIQKLQEDDDYCDMDINELASLFNPRDIVDSAGAWDDNNLVAWFWNNIAEPMDIMAITTNDGAIVFDESLLQQTENIYK